MSSPAECISTFRSLIRECLKKRPADYIAYSANNLATTTKAPLYTSKKNFLSLKALYSSQLITEGTQDERSATKLTTTTASTIEKW
jgi:hypothetical protein